jgi:heavy metal response regulator
VSSFPEPVVLSTFSNSLRISILCRRRSLQGVTKRSGEKACPEGHGDGAIAFSPGNLIIRLVLFELVPDPSFDRSATNEADPMRILIVEDEKKVANFIKKGLEEEHYAVDTAEDGEAGLYLIEVNNYDLIVLDLMIPKIDGLEVLKRLRSRKNNVPVLVLTAKDSVEDRVTGLDTGCDDYLTKPFAFTEFLARVRALLRRERTEKEPILRIADLTLSQVTHKVTRGGREIELTSKEYALLEYFMRNPDKVLTRTMISEHVWDYHFDSMTNVVDVYVNYLRKSIDEGFPVRLIQTVRGVGFILKEE